MVDVKTFINMYEGWSKFVIVNTKKFDDFGNYERCKLTVENFSEYCNKNVESFSINNMYNEITIYV